MMSPKRIFTISILFIGLLICAALGMGQTIQKVKLVIDPWYPWVLGKQGPPTGGVGVELINELYRRMGIETEIELLPFKRVTLSLKRGVADGSWLISKNAQREEFAIFSEPFFSDYYFVYALADRTPAFEWNSWQDLQPYKIGLAAGFYYGEEFHGAQNKYGYRIHESITDLKLIRMLLHGRVDLIILNRTVANAMQRDNPDFKGRLHSAAKPVKESKFYVLFSKKSHAKSLLPRVNATIKKMKPDGTIEKILMQR